MLLARARLQKARSPRIRGRWPNHRKRLLGKVGYGDGKTLKGQMCSRMCLPQQRKNVTNFTLRHQPCLRSWLLGWLWPPQQNLFIISTIQATVCSCVPNYL